jgi:uroporphyrinogen decarboxylase
MTTKRQRIEAILADDRADRLPVAFWRHWPGDDQDALRLSEVTAAYHARYDWDFAKITPSSSFVAECWGARTAYDGSLPIGERTYLERPIATPADWNAITPLDASAPALARQIQTAEDLRRRLGPDVPILMTLFTPLSTVYYLAGSDLFLSHARAYPDEVRSALRAITRTWQDFVDRILDHVDGLFLSSFAAAHSVMSEAEYRELGVPYDLAVLESAGRGWFNVLHLHSHYPMMELARDYPVQAVNWDDRSTVPSLAEGKRIAGKAVLGGIDQARTLVRGTPDDIRREAFEALRACGERGVMLTGGCTYTPLAPEGNLLAARAAVDELGGQ